MGPGRNRGATSASADFIPEPAGETKSLSAARQPKGTVSSVGVPFSTRPATVSVDLKLAVFARMLRERSLGQRIPDRVHEP
jgi:hypothetical protein